MLSKSCLKGACEQFGSQGYAVIPDVWQPDEIIEAIRALERLAAIIRHDPAAWDEHVLWQRDIPSRQLADIPPDKRAFADEQIYIISDIASHDAVLEGMVLDRRCASLASMLLGVSAVCHFSNATIRTADVGCACQWHRDWPTQYCTTKTGRQLRIMICLDGMQDGQGVTRVMPGSQDWGELEWHEWRQADHSLHEEGVPVVCPPGSLVVLGPSVVHGAGANLSPQPRRNLIAQWGAETDIICAQRFEHVTGLSGRPSGFAAMARIERFA